MATFDVPTSRQPALISDIVNYVSGGGALTSVALSMPGIFSVTGSPITSSGTFTVTLVSESANLVFASPNGSAGVPAFRGLVEADVSGLVSDLATLATAITTKVPLTRNIATTSPITGGGALSSDLTLAFSVGGDISWNSHKITSLATPTSSTDASTKGYVDGVIFNFGITLDGGGIAITTGSKGFWQVPHSGTITGWTIIADQSGSIVIDVKRSTYAAFPTTSSIAGTDKPTLSSVQKNTDAGLSGWGSTALTAGDVIEYVVNSASTVTRVNLSITYTKT